jgi:endonuclease YncB( thermonuclease family)
MSKRKPIEFVDFPESLHPGFGPFRAICRHVVDGDTADFVVDVGLNLYPFITIRFLGINAPETNRAESREAGLAAKVRLQELVPPGTPVMLDTKPDPDSFGRYLAVIHTVDVDDVGAVLMAEGHAVPYER